MKNKCQYGGRLPKVRRVVSKLGERNLSLTNLPQRSKRFFRDFFTTIVETPWQFVISLFSVVSFGTWTFFAGVWYLVSYSHNDLTFDNRTHASLHEGSTVCVAGVETFTGYFLYSFEIQTTVGFGERYPTDECPEAIFMFIAQIVVGVFIDGTMVAIMFAKLIRPARRSYHMKFSRRAVVCQRDGKMCLLFRICDPNDAHRIGSNVHACLFGEFISSEGRAINQVQHSMKLEDDGQVLVIFPVTVCHVIDSESPLYHLSARDLLEKRFEIVVTFSGASPSTGQTTQDRTSYLSSEIAWGHRFVNIVDYDYENREYFVDYDRFEVTEEVETPLCSARSLDEISTKVKKYYYNRSVSTQSPCYPSTSKSPTVSPVSPISIPTSPLSNTTTLTETTLISPDVSKDVLLRFGSCSSDKTKINDESES